MQRRNSVQISYYFSLLLVGVVLSAVSRRLEPLYVVLPLVIALLYSRLTRVEPRLTVHCHVAPLRVFEGDHIGVALAIVVSDVEVLAHQRRAPVHPTDAVAAVIGANPGELKPLPGRA